MNYFLFFTLVPILALSGSFSAAQPGPWGPEDLESVPAMLASADGLRAEKSFRLAREGYEKLLVSDLKLDPETRAHAQVCALDCLWRERAAGENAEGADKELRRLIEDLPPSSRWRAEAAESLGDLRVQTGRWGAAPETIEPWLIALKYWGEAVAQDDARPRYIALNFEIADYALNNAGGEGFFPYPQGPAILRLGLLPPLPSPERAWEGDLISWCLRGVLRVSQAPADRARALYMLGLERARAANYDPKYKERSARWDKEAEDYLKQSAAVEDGGEWALNAAWELAQFYENRQRYVEAARAAQVLLEKYKREEVPFYDQALEMRKRITQPAAHLGVNEAFAPESYVRIEFQYRNIDRATLRLSLVRPEDLLDALRAGRPDRPDEALKTLRGERVREQRVAGVIDEKKHEPHGQTLYLEPLPPGIYLAELDAPAPETPEQPRRALFRVSRLALASRSLDDADSVFVVDAETGRPIPGARVWGVFRTEQDKPRQWRRVESETGPDGVARVQRPAPSGGAPRNVQADYYAEHDGQFATTQHWGWMGPQPRGGSGESWAIYTETDRPAYRPGETINWKAILRLRDDRGYRLPTQSFVYAIVRDERGQVAAEGEFRVGEFGSIHGSLSPDRRSALGMLSLELLRRKEGESLGAQPLCRLEEYKLPEYKVTVEPPKQQVKFGAPVPFAVAAEYYFGGPVAGAEVEILVHRRAFWPAWSPPRPYPWFYAENEGAGRMEWMPWIWPRLEPEQVILIKKMKTDAQGKARIEAGALTAEEIRQARDRGIWGFEFRVEARVVDSSRREVRGSGSVKTALTALAAYLTPQRYLYLPGDPVKIDLKTLDPNDQPTAAEGFVTMYRRTWNEKRLNAKGVKEPGYDDAKLVARPAVTNKENGAATIEFTPDEAGCYLFRFETRDRFGEPVRGETVVFVAGRDTRQTGYRSGGVTLITDKDTYARGETAHVLLTVRRPGAAVWFGVEGDAVRELRVVTIEGTVKMLDVPVGEDCQPNFFVTAAAMFDYAAFTDSRRLVVPPKEQFLSVTIRAPKETFKPGEKATVDVEVKDDRGKPVATELSLGIADAAVWAIQGDLAGDIRKAFWSRMRGLNFNLSSSANTYTERLRPKPGKPGEFEQTEDARAPYEQSSSSITTRRNGRFFRSEGALMGRAALAEAPAPMMAMKAVPMAAPPAGSANLGLDAARLQQPERVRTDFSATALWLPSLLSDAQGKARAEVTFPDSLTTWKLTARAADKATRVGEVRREVRTSKPLLVRPQGPRYFIQGDAAVLSAVVNNNTSQSLPVEVSIDLGGLTLTTHGLTRTDTDKSMEDSGEPVAADAQKIRILVPAGGQRRVDWRALAGAPGQARIKTTALSTLDSDAVERTFPIHEYGIEQFSAASAAVRGLPEILERTLTLNLPAERRAGSESLTLWIEPTLARSMLNALDYLAQYPYGCVEQTVSRFVPAVVAARVLRQLGIYDPGLERKLPEMIQAGLTRLADFQNPDGGWGWWREERSDLYMTAYVLQGLGQALRAEVLVNMDMVQRGERFLTERLVQAQDQPDLTAFMLHALALVRTSSSTNETVKAAYDRLWARRDALDPYARALFTIACVMTGQADWANTLARNLRNGMVQDKENGTAHWGRTGVFYRWSDSAVEATAYTMRALLLVEPESELVDQAMLWLVRNRKGNRWENTKDTAVAVRALADYVRTMSEDKPDWRAEIEVNGRPLATLRVRPEDVWTFDGKIEIPAAGLRPGENKIVIRRIGRGALYATAWLTCFTREAEIKPAGNEVFARRRFFRVRQEPTLAGAYKTVREEIAATSASSAGRSAGILPALPALKSSERIEVELELEAKNDYEYLVIEDLKAAGLEPTALKSGQTWGGGLSAHRELRDEKTVFFISRLPQGKHTLTYELRAEIPGTFSALPTLVHAMYVPDIRANSANAKVEIED